MVTPDSRESWLKISSSYLKVFNFFVWVMLKMMILLSKQIFYIYLETGRQTTANSVHMFDNIFQIRYS